MQVYRQISYNGPGVISSSLADARCANLGVDGMLVQLNALMGTAYQMSLPGLRHVLTAYVDGKEDFGLDVLDRQAGDQGMQQIVVVID